MSGLENIFDYYPYNSVRREIQFKEKIIVPDRNTLLQDESLPEFKLEKQKKKVDTKYSFIDLEKLQKINGKKYTVAELREIAKKLNIPVTNSKKELTRLIKIKIDLE